MPNVQTLWISYDQLCHRQAYLAQASQDRVVLLIESQAFFRALPHHQVKLAFFLSALRHFAEELREAGWIVDHHPISETQNAESALRLHTAKYQPSRILIPEPNDYQLARSMPKLSAKFGIESEILPYDHFLTPREDFRKWAKPRNSLRMELHYRRMRQKHRLLIDKKGDPEGGAWNFDADNRLGHRDWVRDGSPKPEKFPDHRSDAITKKVIGEVRKLFPDHPGDAQALWLPVTAADAQEWLKRFIQERLASFGPYEDMMCEGEPILFHSVLSPMLNLGLLKPAECIEAAVEAWKSGDAPLASVEGFIRQIIGWREFVNGVYWMRMPEYTEVNALEATRPLPAWAWTAETEMNCVHQTVRQVLELGYNHHIQRLMVLGNYFLIAGIRPKEVLEWFTAMYVDAHAWVMAANVLGMVLFADGAYMSSKPYAAGSGYISRMSDYCKGCRFKPTVKEGPDACPFHALYWNFIGKNEAMLQTNPRTKMIANVWKKKNAAEKSRLQASAENWLDSH